MDSGFKVRRGLSLEPQATAPTNPVNGDIYYDSTLGVFRMYVAGAWQNIGSTTAGFQQGGNAFGSAAILGTTDANPLELITNSTVQATLDTTGRLLVGTGIATGSSKVQLAGGLLLGNNLDLASAAAGALRWNGTSVQYSDGTSWLDVGGNQLYTFALVNGQASPANITNMVGTSTISTAYSINYEIRRVMSGSSTTYLYEVGNFKIIYDDQTSTWFIAGQSTTGDAAGVTFSVLANGQVQYVSSAISGAATTSFIKFTIIKI